MTTDQDPAALAREVLAIAEKTTPGPWRGDRWDGTAKYAVLAPLDAFPTEYTNETADRWEPVLTLNHKSGEYGFTGHKDGQGEANERLVIHAGTHYANLATAVLALTEERDRMRGLLTEARDALTPLSEYELPIMLLNRIDAALTPDRKDQDGR